MHNKIRLICLVLILGANAFADVKIGYTFLWAPDIKQPELNYPEKLAFGYHKVEFKWAPFKTICPYVGLVLSGFPQKDVGGWSGSPSNTIDPSIKYESHNESISVSSLGGGISIGYLFKIRENCYVDIYNNTAYTWYLFSHKESIEDWNNTIIGEWNDTYKTGTIDLEFGLKPTIQYGKLYISVGAGYKNTNFFDHKPLRGYTLHSNNPSVAPPVSTGFLADESVFRYDISGIVMSFNICFSLK